MMGNNYKHPIIGAAAGLNKVASESAMREWRHRLFKGEQ
jgi:hypothetical protein